MSCLMSCSCIGLVLFAVPTLLLFKASVLVTAGTIMLTLYGQLALYCYISHYHPFNILSERMKSA